MQSGKSIWTLSDEDGRAVDVLFEARNSGLGLNTGQEAAPGQLKARVQCAGQLLGLLDELPTDEPPADLVPRIMQAVRERSPARFAAGSNTASPLSDARA